MEIELKVGLASEADRQRLLKAFGPAQDSLLQKNIFLRDRGGRLAELQSVLRVRRERQFPAAGPPLDTVTLAFKGDAVPKGALFCREETECALGLPLIDVERDPSRLLELGLPPIARLREAVPDITGLEVLGAFENQRTLVHVPLNVEGREMAPVWEVDRTVFPGGRVECELEIELPEAQGHAEVLLAVQRRLEVAGVEIRPEGRSKFARFLQYTRGTI
jgi:inorganic triphosphatase YgiF